MTDDKIVYRGVSMVRGWPERIRAAQQITTCRRNGLEMPRFRYGFEPGRWGSADRPCHDCCVIKGEYHVPGCDVDRCPACGGQLWLGCDCELPENSR